MTVAQILTHAHAAGAAGKMLLMRCPAGRGIPRNTRLWGGGAGGPMGNVLTRQSDKWLVMFSPSQVGRACVSCPPEMDTDWEFDSVWIAGDLQDGEETPNAD